MNFLAHLYLSPDDPDAQAGNLIADFVKGPGVDRLPPKVRAGVQLHRQVDSFTDRHPGVQRSIARVGPAWGWFSGILIDVYYDHLLARDWERWSAEPLRLFADRMYAALGPAAGLVDPEHRGLIPAVIADDRLVRYATADGIADTLSRLSDRIAARMPTRAVRLERAMPDLAAADAGLEADFRAFFPQLRAFSSQLSAVSQQTDTRRAWLKADN